MQTVTSVLDLTSRTVETQQMRRKYHKQQGQSSVKDFHCIPSPHSHSRYEKCRKLFFFKYRLPPQEEAVCIASMLAGRVYHSYCCHTQLSSNSLRHLRLQEEIVNKSICERFIRREGTKSITTLKIKIKSNRNQNSTDI